MGWLGDWFSGGSKQGDPLQSLDPKLREFLQKESPVKYTTASEQEQAAQQQAQEQAQQMPAPQQQENEDGNPIVPPQSLFQDGRYAHLWKTYRPLGAIEAETKTDHEKLMDVLEGYKERKAMIGRAALENCAEEQLDWRACMTEGEWTKRAMMCRDEVRKFERCYMVQSVSYLSEIDWGLGLVGC